MSLKIGDRVRIKPGVWKANKEGVVTERIPDRYNPWRVRLDDNTDARWSEHELEPIAPPPVIKAGDRVRITNGGYIDHEGVVSEHRYKDFWFVRLDGDCCRLSFHISEFQLITEEPMIDATKDQHTLGMKIRLTLSTYELDQPACKRAAAAAFGPKIEAHFGRAFDTDVICRPDQFAIYMYLRNKHGGTNNFKSLNMRLINPPASISPVVDVTGD
jgi:hypothetical protein